MILDDAALQRQLLPASDAWQEMPGLRQAAVLIPLFRRADADWILFTLRRNDLPHHPGQVSFPGGRRDQEEDPITCALRECQEEIGQVPVEVELLGSLPPRTSSSSFRVHTLVGRIPDPADLRADPNEVESILHVPVGELFDRARWEDREYHGGRQQRTSPHFDHGPHTIWGLTGRLTIDLLDRVRSGSF